MSSHYLLNLSVYIIHNDVNIIIYISYTYLYKGILVIYI